MVAGFGAEIAGGGLSCFGWKRPRRESATLGIAADATQLAREAASVRVGTLGRRIERNVCATMTEAQLAQSREIGAAIGAAAAHDVLSSLACPPDWIASPENGGESLPPKCYRRLVAASSQLECNELCGRALPGATLVCVDNADEQAFLASAFPVDSSCCGAVGGFHMECCTWIGLYQTVTTRGSEFGWDGWRAPGCTSHFRTWDTGEPDDAGGKKDENCAAYGWEGATRWWEK